MLTQKLTAINDSSLERLRNVMHLMEDRNIMLVCTETGFRLIY
jgi:hypothetical protein